MSEWVYSVVILWQTGLAAALVIFAFRSKDIVRRVLALDTLTPVLVVQLAAVAVHRGEPGYLDVALIVAMLGFVQAVATARLVERRRGEGS